MAVCGCAPGVDGLQHHTKGVSLHSAGTAPITYLLVYPGNTPENHPPTEACMTHSKQHGDPGTRGKLKKKSPVYQQGL